MELIETMVLDTVDVLFANSYENLDACDLPNGCVAEFYSPPRVEPISQKMAILLDNLSISQWQTNMAIPGTFQTQLAGAEPESMSPGDALYWWLGRPCVGCSAP